jgi:uncharacterized protein (DUF952 family)
MLIYHLLSSADWARFLERGEYAPASLASEGFIHFSTEAQVLASAARFFAGHESLAVLVVSEKQVKAHLKWEPAGSGELFPHVYAPLTIDQVEDTRMVYRAGEAWEWV